MDIAYYQIKNDSIIPSNEEISPEDWSEKLDWIDIQIENRKEALAYIQELNLSNDIIDCIEHPEKHPFSNAFGSTIIINLPISNSTDIYQTDYLSLIIKKTLIIAITPRSGDLFNQRNLATYSQKKFATLSNFLFYVLAVKILAQSNTNMGIARWRLQEMELMLKNDEESLSSNDLMSCERDINQLSDIIEDQYVGFQILSSFSTTSLNQAEIQQTNKLIKGFEPLDKAMLRLEKKAESLRLQYMMLQQEKSTRKINVLTIVQAIFVPLTFVAGVYGMNFVRMPELNWNYGYFLVWLVFIGLASGLLIYFYRKGWFD